MRGSCVRKVLIARRSCTPPQFLGRVRLNLQCGEFTAVKRDVEALETRPHRRDTTAVTVLRASHGVADARHTREMLARRNDHLVSTTDVRRPTLVTNVAAAVPHPMPATPSTRTTAVLSWVPRRAGIRVGGGGRGVGGGAAPGFHQATRGCHHGGSGRLSIKHKLKRHLYTSRIR